MLDGSQIEPARQWRPIHRRAQYKQFYKPAGYESDNLINNEIGFKSEFLEPSDAGQCVRYTRWTGRTCSCRCSIRLHLGNTTFDINGPTYRVKGLELQLVARVTEGLTMQGSSSWNSSNQTNAPCLAQQRAGVANGNPTPVGACITQVNGSRTPTRTACWALAGVLPAVAVQPARALRLALHRLQAVCECRHEPHRRHAQRAGELPGRQRSRRRIRSDHDVAASTPCRATTTYDAAHRRRQGQLDRRRSRATTSATTMPAPITSSGQFIKIGIAAASAGDHGGGRL